MPTMSALAAAHLEDADTLQSSVARIAASIQRAHAAAEVGQAEGLLVNRGRAERQEMYQRAQQEGRLRPWA
jgi:hypothetical protein